MDFDKKISLFNDGESQYEFVNVWKTRLPLKKEQQTRAKFALFQLTVFHTSHKAINIIQRDGSRKKNKTNGSVAEAGIRGPFIVNLIKRKLLSSALSGPGGWVGVLLWVSGWGKMKKCFESAGGGKRRKEETRHWWHSGAISLINLGILSYTFHLCEIILFSVSL